MSDTQALPDLSMRMFVDLMLPCVSFGVVPEVWTKARPLAAPAAIFSLVDQSNGVLPGPLFPVSYHKKYHLHIQK